MQAKRMIPDAVKTIQGRYADYSPDELGAIMSIVESFWPSPTVVNIGAGFGVAGLAIMLCKNKPFLYTVDDIDEGPVGSLKSEQHVLEECLPQYVTRRKAVLGDVSTVVFDPWLMIQVVLIGKQNMYENAFATLQNAYKQTADNGMVLIHGKAEDMCRATRDFFGTLNKRYSFHVDTLVGYRKTS